MRKLSSIEKLQEAFASLPGIGQKSAERLAYNCLNLDEEVIKKLVTSLKEVRTSVHQCPRCGLYTEHELCEICSDESRDRSTMIVLAYPKDVYAFDRVETYNGTYHVLNGLISHTSGVDADDLNIDSLLERVNEDHVKELIIATDTSVAGEFTAKFLAKLLENQNILISRLAYGLPVGANLDYQDSLTLERALKGRRNIEEDK